ncbi:MAG: short-chain dehydrogenase [Candidatus Rokubacteria bacterium 13_1_40CM_69_27]|nr:MAG: short-chain dehydrogenase [Candidatus Rokubacteria bacterium 13_1_40CM_69_27]OLC37642.1 MAG: short-chain dehydrogenase [Candidatus Rokubacteria bacterium 13_1_40CM_4_69_5]OLE38414.1 MAG: short-chain dehydrogenase [Candidatus Rokubacteria bacterium 13_1_20CM_2_70_7]
MDLGLKGKVALVTGGSKGIGKAVARGLAEEGAKVAVCARDKATLEAAAQDIARATGAEVFAAAGDLTRPADVQHIVDATAARFARIDILVNNAGAAPGGEILDLTEEDWQKAIQLKFMGYVRCIKAVIPHMLKQGGGRIVNIVGNDGVKPIGIELSPSAANAADLAVTVALAEQYGRRNICVNAINPGPVATERWDQLIGGIARLRKISVDEAQKRAERSIPLGRICTPEEVANVAVFVASGRASFMNGALITLDGGQRKALLD